MNKINPEWMDYIEKGADRTITNVGIGIILFILIITKILQITNIF